MGPGTTHFYPQKVECWLDGDKILSYWISDYPSTIHPKKYRTSSSLYSSWDNKISADSDGRCGVGFRTTHFSTQKADIGTDRDYGGYLISVSSHRIPQVVIMENGLLSNLHFVLLLVIVEVIRVLGLPTFTHTKLIVDLMVVIFCHLRVGIIHP